MEDLQDKKKCAVVVLSPAELGNMSPVEMEEILKMAAKIAVGIHKEI